MTVHITEEDPRFREPFVAPDREPISSPYPVVLYEEQQDPEGPQWEEYHQEIESADIRSIMSDTGAPTSVLLYQQDPDTMLAAVKEHVHWIHHHIKVNLLQLGYYLFWIEHLRLYLHEEQPDMKSWMAANDLNPDIRNHAQDIYKTWLGMRELGFPITRLTSGDISVTKMREMRKEMRDWIRQHKALPEQTAVEEDEDEEEEAYKEEYDEVSLPIVQANPPEDPALVDIKAKLENIAALPEQEVIKDQNTRDGVPDRIALFLRHIKVSREGLATATVTFKCDEVSVQAMFRGYTEFVFNFDGVDGTLSSQKVKAGDPEKIIDQLGGVIDSGHHHQYMDDEEDL